MLGAAKGLLKARYASGALAMLGAFQVYSYIVPAAVSLEEEKIRAADEATAIVAEAMPPEWRRNKMLVFPFGSDAAGEVTGAMEKAIRRLDRGRSSSSK
jgi:hypothetical protein